MTYLLKKRSSALHIPKKRRMIMATFLLSSVESCGAGGHGISSKERGVLPLQS